MTLSKAGATYSGINLTGRIVVTAANVTITNVCVHFDGDGRVNSGPAIAFDAGGGVIENAVVAGENSTNESVEIALGANVVGGSGPTANHDYVYNCGECVHDNGWTLENSYVITNGRPCDGGYSGANCDGGIDHFEDVYCDGGYETINHDTLLNPNIQTAVVFCNTNNGMSSAPCANHLTITNNLMAGGGFILYSCSNASSVGTSTLTFTGNHVARCLGTATYHSGTGGSTCGPADDAGADTHGYWPYGGYFGIDSGTYCPGTAGVTWSQNVWDDNGKTVSCR